MNLKTFVRKRDGSYFGKHGKIKSGLTKRIIAGTLSAFMVLSGNIPTSHALPVPNNAAEAGEVEDNNPVVHVGELMEIGLGGNAQNHAIKFRKQKGTGSYDQYLAFSGRNSYLYTASAGATLKDHYRPADKINETPITPLVYSAEEKAKYGEPTEWRKITQAEYDAMTQAEKTDIDQQYEAYTKAFYKYGGNWKQPGITLASGDNTNYQFQNFNPTSVGGVGMSLFENGKYKSYKNEAKGYVIQRGQVKGNDKLYAEFIEEAIYAQQPTHDGYLTEQPSGVNMITKITNIDEKDAQAFTQYWAADTQIGRDDQAAFRGEGINRFFSGTRTVNNYPGVGSLVNQGMVTAFPISETMKVNGSGTQANDPWFKRAISSDIKMFTGDSYPEKQMPGFLYAIEEYQCGGSSPIDYSQKISNPMTVQIVPTARASVKWPDAKIEKADYLVLGGYSPLTSNYGFHARTDGSGSASPDSGHGVRVNPTLIMPEETKYFGVSYGRSTSDEVNSDGISLSYNGYTQEVTKSNNKYNLLEKDKPGKNMGGDLLLYNTSKTKTFQNVKIRMLLPKGYLVANSTMEVQGSNNKKWTKINPENKTMFQQTADFDVWEYDYGTLSPGGNNPNSAEFQGISIQPPVEITAIPRSKKDGNAFQEYPKNATKKEGVIPAYGFYVVYDGSGALSGVEKQTFEKYTVRERLVKLPYLDPMNLEGTVWRDLSGDDAYQPSEGISNIKAKVSPKKDGTPGADETLSDRGPFKFENGYAKKRDQEYTLSFDAPDQNRLKNFIYRFDETYAPAGYVKVGEGVYVKQSGTDYNQLFDKVELSSEADGEAKGNAKLIFRVKDVSEVPTVSFRLREFLAGKINIIPFMDQDNNDQQNGTEPFVQSGKYMLTDHKNSDYTADPKDSAGFGTLTKTDGGNENTFKVIASRDYTVTYRTPFGYRDADGKSEIKKQRQALASLLNIPAGVDVPIALQAKDVRFAINTGSAYGYTNLAVEPGANDGTGGTIVTKESNKTAETPYDLIFNAWDGADSDGKSKLIPKEELEANKPRREADFTWKILSDTGVLESKYPENTDGPKISKSGQVTIKQGAIGSFKAEVTWKGTGISDTVTVNIVKKADDITLGPNESITKFEILDHPVTVKKGSFKGPFTIQATIKNSLTNAERTGAVSPTQFQLFKEAGDNFEVIPTPGQKSFKIKAGDTLGEYHYKAIYKGILLTTTTIPSINDAIVKIVEEDYDPSTWKLEIIPSTLNLGKGATGTVQYKFTNLLDDSKSIVDATNSGLANATFEATITDTSVANFVGADKKSIKAENTVGTTPLKAKFTPVAGGTVFEAEGTVQVSDPGAVPVGKIGFEEVTTPKTDGILNVGEKAKYKAYIDGNENGQKDSGETYLKYDKVTWSVGNANVSQASATPAGPMQEAVEVTGNAEGTSTLKAEYTDPVTSKRYEGVQPLEVMDLASVKLEPETSIVVKGSHKKEFEVSAVKASSAVQVVQRPQYKLNIVPGTIAKEVGAKTGTKIDIQGLEVGIAKVTATMKAKTSNEGKVLVIPSDLQLKLKDKPLWIEKTQDKTPEFEFTGTGLTPALKTELEKLVKVEKGDPASNVVQMGPNNKVIGSNIGKTTIKASLQGVPGVEDTTEVFVYDNNSLKVEDQTLTTGQVKDVKVELDNAGTRTLVPAKYVNLKFEDETIANFGTPATPNGDGTFKVMTEKVSVKGVHPLGQAATKLTAQIPGTNVTAFGTMTVNGAAFEGPLSVVPSPVVLKGNDADVPITIVDKNGREVPPSMVNLTITNPSNNEYAVGADGKIHLKKKAGGNDVPNTFKVELKSDPAVKVEDVPIVNMPGGGGGTPGGLELILPNFRVAETELTDALTFDNIKVKNGTVERPLSAYTVDKTKVTVQANVLTLDGQVSVEEPVPPTQIDIKKFKGVSKGAVAYRVTVTLPDGTMLTATGKIAVVPKLANPGNLKAKLVAVKHVLSGGVWTQEIIPDSSPANKVRKVLPTFVQLQLYDSDDPTNVLQTVADGALPYFVKDLVEDVASPHFQVTDTGELVNKTVTGGEVQVKGSWLDIQGTNPTPNAIENSQKFEIIDSGSGQIKVEPDRLVIPVGGNKNLDIKYPNGDPVPDSDVTVTPDDSTIADNPNGTTVEGKTPGTTFVTVTVGGYPPVRVSVRVYDPQNGTIGITPDPSNPTGDPNADDYPGGFIARDVIRIPVGGTVKYNFDIDGATLPASDFTASHSAAHSTTNLSTDPATITGNSVGLDEVTFTLNANPDNKRIVKVIVFDPAVPQIGITLDDKPIVYRQTGAADRQMTARLTKQPADNATVMWVLENDKVAKFGSETSYTDSQSPDMARTATVDWQTDQPITAKLTAIVLESGKSDSITLCGLQANVDSIDFQPNPIQTIKNDPKLIDHLGPFNITITDDLGNQYSARIEDFDVVSSTGPITLSGADKRTITATDKGPKTLTLRHRTSGKEVILQVTIPEDNTAVLTLDPDGGTINGNTGVQVLPPVPTGNPTTLPTPVKPGYTFNGWFNASGQKYDNTTPITGDETLTARWTPQSTGGGGGGGGGGSTPSKPTTPTTPSKPTTPTVPTTPSNPTAPGSEGQHVELNKDAKFAYITGYPDNTVKANAPISRAEVAAIFARLMKNSISMDQKYASAFPDVKEGVWYTNYIGFLEGFKILTGYPDGGFRPNNKITRAEFAVIISKFATVEHSKEGNFKDVNAGHWAKEYIDNAVSHGWMGGYPDGTFKPNQPITRAEVVTVVNKMIERTADKEKLNASGSKKYKDLKQSFWAYYDVIEASTDHTTDAK